MFLLLQYDKGMFLSLFPNRTSISPTNFRSFLVLFLHEKEKGERAFKTRVGPGWTPSRVLCNGRNGKMLKLGMNWLPVFLLCTVTQNSGWCPWLQATPEADKGDEI
jgi:hypothetical protein